MSNEKFKQWASTTGIRKKKLSPRDARLQQQKGGNLESVADHFSKKRSHGIGICSDLDSIDTERMLASGFRLVGFLANTWRKKGGKSKSFFTFSDFHHKPHTNGWAPNRSRHMIAKRRIRNWSIISIYSIA